MKNKLLLTVLAILVFSFGFSQNALWTKISEERVNANEKLDRASFPSEYQLFSLNFEALKTKLQTAPSRNSGIVSDLILTFPNADGNLEKYRIYESFVMEAPLAEKHPEIQSYVGQGIDNPTAKIHFTTTIFGLHTMTLSGKGTFYIDPYTKDLQHYIVYNKSSLTTSRSFECLVKDTEETLEAKAMNIPQTPFASDGIFRTYRLAMACTVEYAAYHINAAGLNSATLAVKKAAVLAAMNVTVARVNSVYENDMSLKFVLVANNDQIIYITSDSFTNNDSYDLIDESQEIIDTYIGTENYDIGHTVSTGGGGLASPGACIEGLKASGITGSFAPVGDPYDIDYVAHEVGHQFGASHTFNAATGSCGGGNRVAGFAVEPGSGTTIMAYAGICEQNDVQNNSDAYFHAVSIAQMVGHITGVGECVTGIANDNAPPVVATLTNRIIPKGTAFVLKGSATDADGDALTYCWEQTNHHNTNTSNPSATTTDAIPNFRSFTPSPSPNRYFPALPSILSNSLITQWEVIPNVARTMSFALTVRDNNTPNGGQTERKNMNVTFNAAAGPFKVTSQATSGITWTNTPQTITWNVASTNVAPINTANVNILLSTDGGLTFPITLAANTPNDGTQVISTIPNVNSSTCRIMIEAVNNIFIAVNTEDFTVNNALSTESFGLKDFKLYPNPNAGNFNVEFNSETSTDIKVAIYDIRGRQIFDKTYQNTGNFSQNLQLNNIQSGVYLVNINDGDKKEIRKIIID